MAELTINFLDVGQGDGIFIKFPNDKTMLVDLGSNKNKDLTLEDILKYFNDHTKFGKRNQVLDYLVLTHGDGDHFNMIWDFKKRLGVTITNLLYGGKESDYRGLISGLKKAQREAGKAPITVLRPTGTYPFVLAPATSFGGVSVKVMGMDVPGTLKKTPAWRKNTGSVVLRLEYKGVGVLLSGDATIETEKYILKTLEKAGTLADLKSKVLKVGHHGSARTSISGAWIRAIAPKYIFISSDRSGSLAERYKTGHRLPQQLAIDIITTNSILVDDEFEHTYVSSYDPDDYKKYKDPDTRLPFANPHTGTWAKKRCWHEFTTKKAIFTTLVAMDRKDAEESEFDQGAQYEVTIDDEGNIDVGTTDYEDDDE